MIEGFVSMERPKPEDMEALVQAAKEDSHSVVFPTHVLKKDGKVVGYFSLAPNAMPTVLAWLSTKEVPSRESFHLINAIEYQVSVNGGQAIMWPVPENSPFFPLMEKLGYKNAGQYYVFIKKV